MPLPDALAAFAAAIGPARVLTGADTQPFRADWTGQYTAAPAAVLRPGSTAEVSALLKIAHDHRVPVIPAGGRTGIVGGCMTDGGVMLSLDRMNAIRAVKPGSRLIVAQAGAVLSSLHDAAEAEGLYFPLWFGARGSAMLGGALSTNAGGSNVLRYGNTRALCLGIEVVLPDGRVLDLMSELHKDNTGYDLKDLFIGAEGTLGVITAAVMRLVPAPRAHATAMVALRSVPDALALLNTLQDATGGAVEAFELMPASYMRRLQMIRPDLGQPFATLHDTAILVELGATAPDRATPRPDGSLPLADLLTDTLGAMAETGAVLDAVIAGSTAQRRAMWARREAAGEIGFAVKPFIDTDIALPVDRVDDFLRRMAARLPQVAPGAHDVTVAHLGDGNLHYSVYPPALDAALYERVVTEVEDAVADLGGSFSAEHGIGLSKRPSMARRKAPVALDLMRSLKAVLDPRGIMNPGKVLPD